MTNWDPAKTQQVLTAAIAKYPQIDVIVSDFGPSLVGALPEFEKAGRSIPALVDLGRQRARLLLRGEGGTNPDFKLFTVATGNDHARLAIQWAVALATGGARRRPTVFQAPAFEDSSPDDPNPVTCESDLPGDIYLSAQMSGEDQAALLK